MKITNIGSNRTMITHQVMHESKEFSTDYDVYFSYSQPMVVVDWANRTVYENVKKYSNTTSRHVNEFLRLSNRYDYDEKGKPHMIDKWEHKFANETLINALAERQ